MHAGDRTKAAIDAGGVLPGYTGTIVRDGYAGYDHLTDALHAWCGARGLRDLAGLHRFDPAGQVWARAMADPLIDANAAASAARAAGRARLDDTQLAGFRARYRGAVAKGLADNQGKRTQIGKDGRRLAHPGRARRLRRRPVLPVHRRQVGHRRPRRTHPALRRRPLAPARHRTPLTTASTPPPAQKASHPQASSTSGMPALRLRASTVTRMPPMP